MRRPIIESSNTHQFWRAYAQQCALLAQPRCTLKRLYITDSTLSFMKLFYVYVWRRRKFVSVQKGFVDHCKYVAITNRIVYYVALSFLTSKFWDIWHYVSSAVSIAIFGTAAYIYIYIIYICIFVNSSFT